MFKRSRTESKPERASRRSAKPDSNKARNKYSATTTKKPKKNKVSPVVSGYGRTIAVSLASVLLVIAVGAVLLDRIMHPDAFALKRIQIYGQLKNVDAEQVRVAANQALRGNFFSIDLEGIEHSVREVPWVLDVSIRRKWPDVLAVDIEEINPVARWGDNAWIVDDARIVELPDDVALDHLPILRGPDDSHKQILSKYQYWQESLNQQGLFVKALELSSRRSWKLTVFENPTLVLSPANKTSRSEKSIHTADVLLGRNQIDNRLNRFLLAYEKRLRKHFSQVRQIDLRYPNGFALKQIPAKDENATHGGDKAQFHDQDTPLNKPKINV